ncbi:isochorismate synthase [Aliivibrio fischeri]|uniref:isochorismate synthase n=2 Tax=Aliivibrio fischeri TaxID=668 RepID=A0A510ULW4_ALIFS|nr:isochorismate synthase [Aliivibrio fischeri]
MMSLPIEEHRLLAGLVSAKNKAEQIRKPVLASMSLPWTDFDMVGLFGANYQSFQPATLWRPPHSDMQSVSFSSAYEITIESHDWAQINRLWQQLISEAEIQGDHKPKAFSGFCFDPKAKKASHWLAFPAACLTLPKFSFETRKQQTQLVINSLVDHDSDCHQLTQELVNQVSQLCSGVHAFEQKQLQLADASELENSGQDQAKWQQKVAQTVAHIGHGEVKKIVLSRADTLPFSVCPASLLSTLNQRFKESYLFAFVRNNQCFLGATPERLIALQDRKIQTVALAGSTPRGVSTERDDLLGAQLLSSSKDRYEHDLVVQQLVSLLQPHCKQISAQPQPSLHKLPQIQHLITPISGQVQNATSIIDLLAVLHPSAAVSGLPRPQALQYIREHEALDRGWFAAPIGWLDSDFNGEFAVALRSALVTPSDITLFAGCGLVSGSVPEHEYQESCIKMNAIRDSIRSISFVPSVTE